MLSKITIVVATMATGNLRILYTRTMRVIVFAGACVAIGVLSRSVWGDPLDFSSFDQDLQVYAVHVVRVPKENWTGNGVYLGGGLILTAAHVAGEFWRTVRVEIAGQSLATRVLKRGSFSGVDLALLSVDAKELPISLRLRRMPICTTNPIPGEAVIVATPEGIAPSHVIAARLLPHNLAPKYQTAISDVATTGNSGSGLFDAEKQCLLGIISAKITQTQVYHGNIPYKQVTHDIAKYFVPASEIAKFLAA